jgi:VanZ family protein
MALIFVVSAQPRVPLPDFSSSDKVLHFAAYSVLGVALALGGAPAGVARGALVAAGSLYGATDEIHQHFVPGRSMEALDWVADTLGVMAGVLLTYGFFQRRARAGRGGALPAQAGADTLPR